MNHKMHCDCQACREANKILNAGKSRRFLPKHVIIDIQEKRAREENEMLIKGFIQVQCPHCKHRPYMKIAKTMKCPLCMYEIK